MPNAIYSESVAIPDSSVQGHADEEARATKPTYRASTANNVAIGFAIYAAIRILVFCLAFPPTNGTDEKFHLMSVRMYGAGHLPGRDLPRMDPDFAKTLLLYWSPEFSQLDTNPNPVDASPLSMMTPQERKSALAHGLYKDEVELWLTQHSRRPNYQAQGPPLYYVVAGAWLDLGRTLGIRDWDQVYWIRLLNPMFYGLFVWISYCFVRKVYPEDKFLCLAVPGLLAVFPQDVFFGLSRDVLSPVMCAGALLAMAHAIVDKKEQYRSLLLASFLVGLTFLVEVSNFVLYGALAACLWMWVRDSDAGRRLNILVVTSSAILALALPFLWMSRNLLVIGDLSGSRVKMRALDWTMKPVTELFHHPLFSGHGLSYFLVELTRRFWRGEYVWHRMPMRSFPADAFYLLSTALLMLVFVMGLTRGWKARSGAQRFAGAQSLFLVVVSVLFLALISLPFDFNACPYPSRLYPYFVSGRIICGALLPFSLIYASGLEMVTNLFRKWVPPVVVLACLMLFITFSEIRVRGVVFSSPYNFFALSGSRQ